ncbi:MAG: carbohydrate kinase family protein [Promethearchaeota archaeon]
MSEGEHLWPYVLFLPDNLGGRLSFIRSVLASKIAPGVLGRFDESGRVFQRDLIKQLSHSNKSILAFLKTLNDFGLIRSSSAVRGGKRVVFHELTKNGWGLARFFSEDLPSDLGDLTEYLLEDYLTNLVALYRDLGLDESSIFDVFTRTRAKEILKGSVEYEHPDYALFGSAAYFTEIRCDAVPPPDGEVGCNTPMRYAGGPTLDLALALASDDKEVALVSAVGNDQDGWNVIATLAHHGVDTSHFVVEDGRHTNETIMIQDESGTRTLVGIGDLTALSITSPSQVPWDKIVDVKAVYIGEVFVEVAVSIASYAKANNIPVVYRCSPHYWKRGLRELEPVLRQVDVLVISSKEWKDAGEAIGPDPIEKLQSLSDASIVLHHSKDTYRVHLNTESRATEIPCDFSTDDVTQWFMAGLLHAVGEGLNIVRAVEKGALLENSRLSND